MIACFHCDYERFKSSVFGIFPPVFSRIKRKDTFFISWHPYPRGGRQRYIKQIQYKTLIVSARSVLFPPSNLKLISWEDLLEWHLPLESRKFHLRRSQTVTCETTPVLKVNTHWSVSQIHGVTAMNKRGRQRPGAGWRLGATAIPLNSPPPASVSESWVTNA